MLGNNVKAKISKIFHQPAPADGVPDVELYSLYGAGQLGQLCLDLIRQMGKKVSCVWDQDDKRARTFMESNSIYPISSPDPKVAQEPVIVCVSKVPIAKLFSDLEAQGFTRLINFYDFANRFADRTGFTNGWRFDSISTQQIADLTLLAERFADTQSVVHCLEFLTWHRLRRASGL